MALTQPATWLIAYDIRSPRRLKRVHRYLSGVAISVQYSVFVTRCTVQRLGIIRAELAGLINKRDDDVRIYRVPERPLIETLGRQGTPEGIMLLAGTGYESALPLTRASRVRGDHVFRPDGRSGGS